MFRATAMNRRAFLARAAATGLVGTGALLGGLGSRAALAATTGGYRALVCVNLKGGMDHADTLLPADAESYRALVAARGDLLAGYGHERPESSRHLDSLLALNPDDAARFGGRRFGLPRELAGLHALFEAGEAAVVGNVGPLVQATDRTSMAAGATVPERLYAHNSQQSTWQSLHAEGARFGWGGQLLDATLGNASTIDALYAAITATDSAPFLAGTRARAFRVPAVGKSHDIRITRDRRLLGASRYELARALLDDYLQDPNAGAGGPMRRDVARASADGIRNLRRYNALVDAATPFAATFPSSRLGGQLASVARAISLRDALGTPRQVFYVTLAGLDTHTGQRESLPGKHEQIGTSLAAFRDAMVELGVWDDVTVFTMSDFGRTLVPNGNGTDHGWGSHHFVAGGAVAGRRIVGDLPEPDPASERHTVDRARMIPTLSIEQYAAALGRWFGLDDAELGAVFPNLARFDSGAVQLHRP